MTGSSGPSGVLGHLALNFAVHPENVTTEGLGFVLRGSLVVRTALRDQLVAAIGTPLADDLVWENQAVDEEQTIPDLVASSADRKEVVLLEAKFWAGLTDNQPVAYLRRLGCGKQGCEKAGLLVFIAPALRIATLWPELRQRCKDAKLHIGEDVWPAGHRDFVMAPVDGDCQMALASWDWLLSGLRRAAEAADYEAAADLRQLEGVARRMDKAGFLPLRGEELGELAGHRIVQFCKLVDDATQVLRDKWKLVFTTNLKATAGPGWYGRYLTMKGQGCRLCFNADLWSQHGRSPIWFEVYGVGWKPSRETWDALSSLKAEDPPRLYASEEAPAVPLILPTGVERKAVLEGIVQQVRGLHDLISAVLAQETPEGPPPDAVQV